MVCESKVITMVVVPRIAAGSRAPANMALKTDGRYAPAA